MLLLIIGSIGNVFAQPEIYNSEHDDLPFYFGISFGYNSSFLHLTKSANFIKTDSTLSANVINGGSLNIGLAGTLRLSKRFELRAAPQIIVGGRETIAFRKYDYNADSISTSLLTLPTTILSFPLHVKFNSDRIENFKMYLFAGAKCDFDLSANSNIRKSINAIQLKKENLGLELGIGCNFYLPVGIISPEIKVSNGYVNMLLPTQTSSNANLFEKIESRMIVFTLLLQD